jgi:hypothetical protein
MAVRFANPVIVACPELATAAATRSAAAEADRLVAEALDGRSDSYPDVVVRRHAEHGPAVARPSCTTARRPPCRPSRRVTIRCGATGCSAARPRRSSARPPAQSSSCLPARHP